LEGIFKIQFEVLTNVKMHVLISMKIGKIPVFGLYFYNDMMEKASICEVGKMPIFSLNVMAIWKRSLFYLYFIKVGKRPIFCLFFILLINERFSQAL
jgi:hypothetical protein